FTANQGEADPQVKFILRGNTYTVFLMPTEALISLDGSGWSEKQPAEKAARSLHSSSPPQPIKANEAPGPMTPRSLRMTFLKENRQAILIGLEAFSGSANANHRPATYERVRCEEIYPNVSLVFQGNHRELRYDFILAPGANPRAIK